MNFITYLPKRHPEVKYIVASSYTSSAFANERPCEYRMHVATLVEGGQYLLCHVRQISGESEP